MATATDPARRDRVVASAWPPWAFLWILAFSIYVGLKWFSFADSVDPAQRTGGRWFYLLLWPGMDAKAFFTTDRTVERPSRHEWVLAVGKTALGAVLLFLAASRVQAYPMLAGWVGPLTFSCRSLLPDPNIVLGSIKRQGMRWA